MAQADVDEERNLRKLWNIHKKIWKERRNEAHVCHLVTKHSGVNALYTKIQCLLTAVHISGVN